jgi:FkbM family methyltransferase
MKSIQTVFRNVFGKVLGYGIVNFRNKGVIDFIDVGAVGSLPPPWNFNADEIRFLLKFEHRDKPRRNKNIMAFDAVLWKENLEKEFYIYKGFGGSGSSLFRQNVEYVKQNFDQLGRRGLPELADTWFERSRLDKVEKVKCRKLDDILLELNDNIEFDFLKIDAQGAEYEILQGAKNLLSTSCVGLHLELFVVSLYKGITLLPEVEKYLNQFGFKLVKKFPPHGTFDSQHDCVFLKQDGNFEILQTIKRIYGL